MSRTKGFHVRLWRQGTPAAEERTRDAPEFIMDGDAPQLFMTEADATEAGRRRTEDEPELTFAIEPVVP